MVTSLGNAPSQPKGNSFTDCPASLAEYLATMAGKAGFEPGIIASRAQRSTIKLFPSMAGADRIELPSRILEIRSIAISPCPLEMRTRKAAAAVARSLQQEF